MNFANKGHGEVEHAIQMRNGEISTDLFAEPLSNYVGWVKASLTPFLQEAAVQSEVTHSPATCF